MRLVRSHSAGVVLAVCVLLVLVVGYLDYVSGVDNSMLLFYLLPIALATWRFGIFAGVLFSAISISISLLSDVVAGIPRVNAWNVVSGFGGFAAFAFVVGRWRALLQEMHSRIEARTAALRRELAARKQLENEIAAIAERERARVGRELHDSLCQHLTGTSLLAQTVSLQVQQVSAMAAAKADKVVTLINEGIELTREIARGLLSFELEADGLGAALESLAKTMKYEQEVACEVKETGRQTIPSQVANHLYWIAREAVTNAVKHGQAKHILINLRGQNGSTELTIQDNGKGMPEQRNAAKGLGLKLMRQRAQLAGGSLEIDSAYPHGVIVRCKINNENS